MENDNNTRKKEPIEFLYKQLRFQRENLRKKKKLEKSERKNLPIASWSKKDRLLKEIGKELCIILKTNGCAWSRSNSGGCTMCGYYNDRAEEPVTEQDIISQFDFALNKHKELINNPQEKIAIKIFNSGSFLDDNEIPEHAQKYILETVGKIETIKEIVIESLPGFITDKKLTFVRDCINQKYLEFGIGLESANSFIEKNIINKPFDYQTFLMLNDKIHQYGLATRAYLLLKPPFLSEIQAIVDTCQSIQFCIDAKIDTISINPVNVQENTICKGLYQLNAYTPPSYYSLFVVLRSVLNQEILNKVRVICDPSGAGSERGIHSCYRKECRENMKNILEEFVFTQDINKVPKTFDCICYQKWKFSLSEQ